MTFDANIRLKDKFHGNTALHWACSSGNHVAVKLLLNAGSGLDIKNDKVTTAAAVLPLVPICLDHGDANYTLTLLCQKKKRALFIAGDSGTDFVMCFWLYFHHQGETPIVTAIERKNLWIVQKLQQAMHEEGHGSKSTMLGRLSGDKVSNS